MRPLAAALVPLALSGCAADPPDLPPNIVILLCDNLGYGDVEPFGSEIHSTPNLNRMAREGRKLTHFYASAGVCTPSRASLLTGCYAQRVGLHRTPRDGLVLRPVSPYGISSEEITIAEVLRARGYATAIIGKWHLGDQPEFLPMRHGFDSFFGIPYSDDMTQALGRGRTQFDGDRWPPLPLMRDDAIVEAPADRNLLTKRYTEHAVDYIDANRRRPFFLLLAHAMPGSEKVPFASEEFRGSSRNGAWGDAVEELDWSTGRILDKLVEAEVAERTLVLWTSDNGAPLAVDPASPTRGSNQPLHGRGYTTAEGGFRVPAIAWWPGTIPAGSTTDEVMSVIDLLPTLSAVAGAEVAGAAKIDGVDVGDAMLGKGAGSSPRQELFYYHQDQLQAVRSGPWKLFLPIEDADSRHPHRSRIAEGEPLLFNVVEDPGSREDRAAEEPEVVRALLEVANRARAELGDRGMQGAGQRPPGFVKAPQPVLPAW